MSEKKLVPITRSQWLLLIAILLSALIGLVMGFLQASGLQDSALLYIGVPTIIALAFTRLPTSKSVMGATLKAITFVILISGPLLQEGFICMIMAAPLMYIIGALVAWPIDHYRKKRIKGENTSRLNVVVLPALFLLMSMEGVFEQTSFNQYQVAEQTQIINASVTEIKNRLGQNRPLAAPKSLFARIFPRPELIRAYGLEKGDRHWLDLRYVKWVYWNEKRGSVQFEVVQNEPLYIKFKPISDSSYIRNYLAWGNSEVILLPITADRTQVTWRINYQRKLNPAWYMQPLQSYSVAVVAKLFLASLI